MFAALDMNTTKRPSADSTPDDTVPTAGTSRLPTDTRVVWPVKPLAIPAPATIEKKMSAAAIAKTPLMLRILVPPQPHDPTCGAGFVGRGHPGVYGSEGSPPLGAVLTPYLGTGCAAIFRPTQFTRCQ